MSTPFVGEIRMFGFPRVPSGWFACDGSLQSIAGYETLYTLIGTTYGGDGQTTFGLPDLRGALPMHEGNGTGLTPRVIGQAFGTEEVTLISQQMPQHNHPFLATQGAATTATPGPALFMADVSNNTPADVWYLTAGTTPPTNNTALAPASVTTAGNSLPHENCQPTLTTSYCIAWAGVFPSRN